MTGLASGSFPVEFISSISDSLRESGVDMKDDKAVEAKLRDPKFIEEAGKRAMTRGTVIAAADAVSGKLLAPFKAGQLGKNVVRGVGNVAKETGTEMGGEAAAQLATGEELKVGDILAEGFGGGPQAVGTTALKTITESRKPTQEAVDQLNQIIKNAPVATESVSPETAPQVAAQLPPMAAPASQNKEMMLAEAMGTPVQPVTAPTVTPQAAEAATVTAQVPEAAPVNATPKDEQAAPFKPIKVKPIAPDEFNQRIAAPEIQASLKRYANEAGWAEIGGKMIRSVADDYSAPVVGRTKWIPNADWWLDRPVNLKGDINGGATRNAINKALAGEKLKPNERKMVDYLIKQHDFEMTEGERQRAEIEQRDREVAEFNKQFETLQTQEEAAATQAEQEARIKAQEDAAIQAEMDRKAAESRAEIARLSEEQAQNFALGQTPEESLTGQQRLDDDIPFFSKSTAEQNQVQQKIAEQLKGQVVWQKGDLGLIRGYGEKTGEPMYIFTKNGAYTNYDIAKDDRLTPKYLGITPEQKQEILDVRENLEKEAEQKHAATPYLNIGKGITGSKNLPKDILNVARGWANLLGIKHNVHILTKADAEAQKEMFTGPHRVIGFLGTEAEFGNMKKMLDGNYVIVINPSTSKIRTLETLAHEMGHIHEKETFKNADIPTKNAIIKEFNAWYASQEKTSVKELIESLRPKMTAQQTAITAPMSPSTQLGPYWRKFEEWYSDQVSRWATTSEKPLSVVDKFFAKLAAAMKKFYATVKGQKYLPTQTMKDFLDNIARQSQFDAIVDQPDKDQMTLFSKSVAETEPVTNTPAFKRWFGDSKIVNEDGSPKVVYHGTDKPDFSIFDPASWFSENKKESSMYARPGDIKTRERLLNKYKLSDDTSAVGKRVPMASVLQDFGKLKEGKLYAEGGEDGPVYKYLGNNKFEVLSNVVVDLDNATENPDGSYDILLKEGRSQQAIDLIQETKDYAQQEYPGGENGRVYPVYLSIKNPLRLSTLEANRFSEKLGMSKKDILDQVKKWKAQGYDGIITSSDEATTSIDVRDAFGGIPEQYIPFDSNQIKSATGNKGTFNPDSGDITEAKATTAPTKRKNYLGEQAPLAQWDMPDNTKMESFIYKIQDKYIDTKRAIQAIKSQVGEIADQWDAYLKEELYHGRTAKKVKDFLNDELLPIVQMMQKNGITLNEFDDYLHNRHAEERNIQIAKINPALPDAGSGITTQDAADYMAKLPPAKAKALEAMADKVDKMIQKTQKILVNAGLESQDTIDIWNQTYKHYVPLMREDLDFSQKFGGTGAGFSTKGSSGKRAVGSLKEVADIFANIAAQRERAIVRSEKARVGRALYGLAILNPNPGFWLPVNPDAIKDQDALIKELKAMGIDAEDAKSIIQEPKTAYIDEKTGLVAYRVNPLLRNSDNVFSVRIDGKDRFIFFNPNDERAMRMVSAIKNLDAEGLGPILGTAARYTRWIASVNTQYNPVFGAYNFIRDVGGAQFNLTTTLIAGKQKEVTAGVFPALFGIYKDLRSERAGKGAAKGEWAELWEEFQREGGATGYRDQFSKSKEELNIIEKNIRELEKGNIKKGVQAVFNWLSDYNDALENAVRLSAYKVALDQGISKERAASIAKNLTVNFNRKGAWGQQANALYAFFGSSVQGTTRLMETLKGPKGKQIIAGGLLLGSVQALALAMAGFGDDEPPEFVKERNLIIPLGGGSYFAIPMPLGLHVIPNAGRIATEMVLNGGKGSAKKIGNMLGVMLDAFNPVGNAGLSAQTLSPTLGDPIVAIFENKDPFGRPIAKEDRATNPSPGYTRSRDTASAISKGLSEFLNYASGGTKYQKGLVSPTADQLDFLIGQATGGVGREVMKTEQAITSLVTGEELPSYKVPLVGKFYGDINSQAAQSNKFYDNITNMANHEAEIKGRKKNGENVSEYLEDHPEARLWSQANTLENEISKLNREKKDLIERKAPRERIKRIEDEKTRIMTRFNERVRKLEEQ